MGAATAMVTITPIPTRMDAATATSTFRRPNEAGLGMRNVAVLGVAGGLVPSASALIVLLAAVTTGRLAFGLALIGAFGIGMAVVLGGLAAVTAFARGWLDQRALGQGWLIRRTLGLLPAGSGMLVLGIGLVITITALGSMS